MELAHDDWVEGIAVARDGAILIVYTNDGATTVWDAALGTRLRETVGEGGGGRCRGRRTVRKDSQILPVHRCIMANACRCLLRFAG